MCTHQSRLWAQVAITRIISSVGFASLLVNNYTSLPIYEAFDLPLSINPLNQSIHFFLQRSSVKLGLLRLNEVKSKSEYLRIKIYLILKITNRQCSEKIFKKLSVYIFITLIRLSNVFPNNKFWTKTFPPENKFGKPYNSHYYDIRLRTFHNCALNPLGLWLQATGS